MKVPLRGIAMVLALALLAAACGQARAGDDGPPADDRSSASFVGMALDEAGERADLQGRSWRVIRLDGEDQIVTADFRPDRLNFTVEAGVVTDAATDEELAGGS